jgi:hypothetical protein
MKIKELVKECLYISFIYDREYNIIPSNKEDEICEKFIGFLDNAGDLLSSKNYLQSSLVYKYTDIKKNDFSIHYIDLKEHNPFDVEIVELISSSGSSFSLNKLPQKDFFKISCERNNSISFPSYFVFDQTNQRLFIYPQLEDSYVIHIEITLWLSIFSKIGLNGDVPDWMSGLLIMLLKYKAAFLISAEYTTANWEEGSKNVKILEELEHSFENSNNYNYNSFLRNVQPHETIKSFKTPRMKVL